tara:strand:+ start:86 stop:1339 length:1254 start_codon:yes stop_codon:yes gene_type:complete
MFKRGGSTGGITANLKKPRMGFKEAGPVPSYQDILAQYMQAPEEPKGLTSSDYLRLAAAGAEIMGAQPTSDGSGFMAALSSAGPALSGAATDIASSLATRKENYRTGKRDYDAAMGQAAVQQASDQFTREASVEDREDEQSFTTSEREATQDFTMGVLDREHEMSLDLIDAESQASIRELIKQKELGIGILEKDFVTQAGNESIEKANAAIEAYKTATTEEEKAAALDAYKIEKNNFYNGLYGETTLANIKEVASLLADESFTKLISKGVQNVIDKEEDKDPNSVFYNMDTAQIQEQIAQNMFNMVVSEVYFPEFPGGMAKGGRVGLANGGGPYEPGSGPDPDPGSPPIMQASPQDIEMTFAELRRRLPPEVNDGVIKLIMSSEQAMIDFAQLMTPDDIATFNEKYNVDLQYPTQVA